MKVLKMFLLIGALLLVLTACTPEGEILPELQGPVSVFIRALIEYLILPLLLMLIAWVFGLIKAQWEKFALKNPDEAYWISYVIQTVVQAAEQTAEAYPDEIEDKKAWAIARAEAWFAKLGITLDIDQISDLIEAEVKALFNPPDWMPEEDIRG